MTCHGTGLRKKNWYEFYKGVSGDAPKQAIIDLVATLRAKGYIICIVSGRPIRFLELEVGKQTVAWLKENGVRYDHIFMRQSADKRDDTIVKKEILDRLPKIGLLMFLMIEQRLYKCGGTAVLQHFRLRMVIFDEGDRRRENDS